MADPALPVGYFVLRCIDAFKSLQALIAPSLSSFAAFLMRLLVLSETVKRGKGFVAITAEQRGGICAHVDSLSPP